MSLWPLQGRIVNGLAVNVRPSTPLCQNCLKTELYCQSARTAPTPEKCCELCEHHRLPADLRPQAHVGQVKA